MQLFKLFIFFLTYVLQLICVQSELDYKFFGVDINVNPEYISHAEARMNDDYRGIFVNFTIIKRYPEDVRMTFDAVVRTMRKHTGKTEMYAECGICDAFGSDYQFLGKQFEQLGFSKDDCPPSPNVYGNENIVLDLSKVSDKFIPINYIVTLKVLSETVFISEMKLFMRVN